MERAVLEGIHESGVERSEVTIATLPGLQKKTKVRGWFMNPGYKMLQACLPGVVWMMTSPLAATVDQFFETVHK